jgi:hypothetical protein
MTATLQSLSIVDAVAKLRQMDRDHGGTFGDLNTDNEKTAWHTRSNQLMVTISGLLNTAGDDKWTVKLVDAEARRKIVTDAQATIDQLIADAEDWRTIPDARTRDLEWGRQETLKASKKALLNGVEYFNGYPAVPNPLRVIFGVIVDAQGRSSSPWYGSLPEIDEEIARLKPVCDERRQAFEQHLKMAQQLLGETVTA